MKSSNNCNTLRKKSVFTIKGLSLLAALLLVFTTLCGCSEIRLAKPMGEDTLLIIDDEECSMKEAIFALMQVRTSYHPEDDPMFWDRAIGDITFEEYIKDSVQNEMMRITSSMIMADELLLYLTDEQKAQSREEAGAAFMAISHEYDLTSYGITLETVQDLYLKRATYDMVYYSLSDDVTRLISESDTKVIEVNYVELPTSVSVNNAEQLRVQVKNGTDFQRACQEFGYEPVMNQVLKKGQMPTAFEDVAYALLDGELSEIVETADCLYIVQCIEDYMITESVANYNKVITAAREERFNAKYTEFSENTLLRFNTEAWEAIRVQDL